MRLKRVKIFGFKTFADRTEFSLDGGIVAVVGPNGCGKSNLVDAILWALGEGNVKHLRASSSQDVIFSGSQKRKAVGYAEVQLCFDNEDGALPIDSAEVWVTRKLTRDGGSDYSINRQSCRLRDVLELLADSGLGRAGYAIVGQKEIDQALAASAEDRRAWIDEAAGVQRYRSRKVESLKRLATAKDSLTRVDDIIRELDAQREPLAEEAEIAKRYKAVNAALREVEIGLLIKEICSAIHELEALEVKIAESLKRVDSEKERADLLDNQAKVIAAELSELEREMDDVRAVQQATMTALERSEANEKIVAERLNSLDAQEKNLQDDGEAIAARLAEATRDHTEAKQETADSLAALMQIQQDSAGASEESKALTRALQEAEKELNRARSQKNQRLKWEAEREANEGRIRALKREVSGVEKTLPDLKTAVEEARNEFESAASKVSSFDSEIQSIREQIEAIKKSEEDDAANQRKSLAEKASLEGRKRGIEATLDANEGLSQGSKAVLDAADRGILQGNYQAVGDAVEVDVDYALAIETALGASANDLIVDHESDAKRAISWLKDQRAGRCTFQPIPLMRPQETTSDLRRVLMERGVVGLASELVSCENRVRPVIDSLLGRVVIVDTIDDALKLAKTRGWSRMVTLDGEVVHSSGAVTGGQNSRQGYGIVQRKADLAEIEKDLTEIEKIIAGADKRKSKRDHERGTLETKLTEILAEKKEAESPVVEAQNFLRTLEGELRDAERQLAKAQKELTELEGGQQGGIEDVDLSEFESRRDELLKQVAAKSADAEQAITRLREAQERVRQAQSREYAAGKRFEAARDADSHRGQRLENLGPEREKLQQQIVHHRAEAAKHEQEKAIAMTRLSELSAKRKQQLEVSMQISEEAKSARENLMVIGQANHQSELNRARAETRRATLAERLMDAYGLTEQDALAQENDHEVPDDAQALVSRLRREIKAMGDVNVGAIEAFERLTERFETLTLQRDDILQGISQVEASVQELDKLTRDKFLTTFESVRTAFAELFTRLFGGGAAALELTDPNSVLESGVDISVQLPGKKQQPLQLLSGGERSLCASAFLFALLKTKPAPLVVLDEVDAPLDGRNVERFAEALVEFSDTIQFIVITHNPTTIEVAPNWLGVTMQEPGVSTLVPARLPDSKAVVRDQAAIPANLS